MNAAQDRMRALPGIRATQITGAPEWALVQRQLLTTIEAAGDLSVEWFEDAAGNEHFVHDVDDVYESRRADPSNVHPAAAQRVVKLRGALQQRLVPYGRRLGRVLRVRAGRPDYRRERPARRAVYCHVHRRGSAGP